VFFRSHFGSSLAGSKSCRFESAGSNAVMAAAAGSCGSYGKSGGSGGYGKGTSPYGGKGGSKGRDKDDGMSSKGGSKGRDKGDGMSSNGGNSKSLNQMMIESMGDRISALEYEIMQLQHSSTHFTLDKEYEGERYDALQAQHEQLKQEHEQLKQVKDALQEKHEQLKEEYECERYDALEAEHEKLKQEHIHLKWEKRRLELGILRVVQCTSNFQDKLLHIVYPMP
jgi:hypothetical protein